MSRGRGSLLVLLMMMLSSGCALKSPELRSFTLSPSYRYGRVAHSPYREQSVKVAYPGNVRGKPGSSINFSYSRLEVGSYQNAAWAASSSQLLAGTIIRALEHGAVFKSVIDYGSLANTDYLLESEIYDLYHRVRKNSSVSVVSIRFDLISTEENRLVKSRKFSYEIPTGTVDAAGYVEATNKALEKLSADLVRWLAS